MTGRDRTGWDGTGRDWKRNDRTDCTGQEGTGEDSVGKDRTRHDQDTTRQVWSGKDRAGHDRTRQGWIRQDKTGRDKTRHNQIRKAARAGSTAQDKTIQGETYIRRDETKGKIIRNREESKNGFDLAGPAKLRTRARLLFGLTQASFKGSTQASY